MESTHLLSVSVFTVTSILFFHPHSTLSLNHGNTALPYFSRGDVSINCGSKWNSTALDGREWTGESDSASISGQSTSSAVVAASFLGADHVPYMTSRISSSPFHFTFQVSPGQKFIRLHFYPALYRGFENSLDLFTVKSGPFILLSDFSPTHGSYPLGVNYIVKEFCLNVEQHGKLRITFSPSNKSHTTYAFVNGIEIVSMPTGLYYTPDGDAGAPVVGQNNRFYGIHNRTALEMVQRLNIGGSYISSVEDIGMFRGWNADAAYFLDSGASIVNYSAPRLAAYNNLPGSLLTAPPKVFQTSWKSTAATHQLNSFTWKIPITSGFGYLVRLHFCDLDAAMAVGEQKEFNILINNHIAETRGDVMRWSDSTGFPVYRDYVVMMKGDKEGSECNLFIVLESLKGLSLELLKGIEIFRLSSLQNSFATSSSSPGYLMKVPTNWNWYASRSNEIMLVVILTVSTAVCYSRIVWKENVVNDAAVEQSHHRFSLADIKSATQNFSDAHVIGRGGFGKVYKGLICGFPEIVAIKRLSSVSSQGAQEFRAEIETLSKLRHCNLVSLIGYCEEDEEMILVYEYIPGGTLDENLYKFARKGKECAPVSWEDRLRICIGAARGLEYLHTGSETGIIHRDVKGSNILLDVNLVAKISDFGLSKLEERSQSYVSTKIKGTIGYLDPHYRSTRRLTKKSDVYSFGVVMLVVLSGRPALDSANPSLVSCFRECLSRKEYDSIVDANLRHNMSPGSSSLREFVTCVESCLQQNPKNRPTMVQLVANLERALQLQQEPSVSTSGPPFLTGKENQAVVMHNRSNSGVGVSTPDEVWDRFMPADYRDILIRSPEGLNLLNSSMSRKELYLHICDNPLLIDHGTKSFTLDKASGKKRIMLSARALEIEWSKSPEYWRFIPHAESRFHTVAELVEVCWLEIKGVINTKMLSPNTKYGAYLVFAITSGLYGFEHPPAEISVGFKGQKCKKQYAYLDHVGAGEAGWQIPKWGKRHTARTSKQRSDGWLEIELGEVYTKENKNFGVEMRFAEVKGDDWKKGIVVEGIEIRAKEE